MVPTSNDFINIDILYLQYDKERKDEPATAVLTEMGLVDTVALYRESRRKRFDNTSRGKFLSERYSWYTRRIKEFIRTHKGKEILISKWKVRSGHRQTFTFNGKMYPNVAYTFDQRMEHWFFARIEKRTKSLSVEYKSRSVIEPPPIKDVLTKLQPNGSLTSFTFPEDLQSPYIINDCKWSKSCEGLFKDPAIAIHKRVAKRSHPTNSLSRLNNPKKRRVEESIPEEQQFDLLAHKSPTCQPVPAECIPGHSEYPTTSYADEEPLYTELEERIYTEIYAKARASGEIGGDTEASNLSKKSKGSFYQRFLNKCAKLGKRLKVKKN